jgi:hypothetical protein
MISPVTFAGPKRSKTPVQRPKSPFDKLLDSKQSPSDYFKVPSSAPPVPSTSTTHSQTPLTPFDKALLSSPTEYVSPQAPAPTQNPSTPARPNTPFDKALLSSPTKYVEEHPTLNFDAILNKKSSDTKK